MLLRGEEKSDIIKLVPERYKLCITKGESKVVREEYPRPQLVRENYTCLNGVWQFMLDNGRSGVERRLYEKDEKLSGEILVPFCPQSQLSKVAHTDFILGCVYKRTFTLPEKRQGERTILHFGAVDYHCNVYVNDVSVGSHTGGYTSFEFDITDAVFSGDNTVTVFVEDDEKNTPMPRGKQSDAFESYGCSYTRTTGIWQTVWIEQVPETRVKSIKYITDIVKGSVTAEIELIGEGEIEINTSFEGRETGSASAYAKGKATLTVILSEKHLWETGKGNLYDVTVTFAQDKVKSYFGLREVSISGKKILLNGKPVFQRLVLDQGFYPDGIYTAPTDSELENDIKRSLACGFNGARLHQKVFEERFLYYCDKLGYIVWGEFASWGTAHNDPNAIYSFLPQWLEAVERDRNHPSIICWCPFNETWDLGATRARQFDELIRLVYRATKSADSTRPCIDTSGWFHVETDIYDLHDYEQNPQVLKEHFENLGENKVWQPDWLNERQKYKGEPFFVSEYGGIAWNLLSGGWGYGEGPKTLDEFYDRFKGLADAMLDNENISGFCYTQLTDVEQEQNGLYSYDRKPKFDCDRLKQILSRKAAYEK